MAMKLSNSLEALNVIASNISEIKFSSSREFTNALLHSTEIVSLIRDTEPHERALFTAKPATHAGTGGEPQTNTAVGAYLGDDMAKQLRSAAANSNGSGEVDVDLLLRGAERLLEVYPIPRGPERIATLRAQYEQSSEAIYRLEFEVNKLTTELEQLSGGTIDDLEDKEEEITNEMIEAQLRDLEDMESRKLSLETEVSRMHRQMGLFD